MFSRPITERSKAKPMQSRITFDTQLKIALMLDSLLCYTVNKEQLPFKAYHIMTAISFLTDKTGSSLCIIPVTYIHYLTSRLGK